MAARIRYHRHRGWDGLRRGRLRKTQAAIGRGGIPNFNGTEATATFQNAVNEVTLAGLDDLANGTQVVFYAAGALPAALEEGVGYFLREAGTNQYTLHPTAADAAADTNGIALADDGSGVTTAYIFD